MDDPKIAEGRTRLRILALPLALGLLGGALSAARAGEPTPIPPGVSPAALLADLRSIRPDLGGAVSLRDAVFELGPARFEVERGILVPVRTLAGRTLELVFVGQARVRLEAPDEIEAGQLELFTGDRSLDAPVEEAVFALGDPAALRSWLAHPAPRELRPELLERIAGIHGRWLAGSERRRAGVETSLFKTLSGDDVFRHYFAAWFRSFELGDFVLQLDPEDIEPITLARFQPLDLRGWERARLRHQIRAEQRKERWLQLRVEDLGSWDIWLSTTWQPRAGPVLPGHVGFESKHYALDVKLDKSKLRLDGHARLDLAVRSSGRRVVRLALHGDLAVRKIADDAGRELYFFRSDDEIVVALEEPSRAGDTIVLDIDYGGRALRWVRGGIFDMEETGGWYPHCGTVDRATYDVTLRWPRRREVVAGGRLVAQGRAGDYRWERRVLDVPSIAFSFMVGEFDVEHRQVGHVDVALAVARDPQFTTAPGVSTQTLETVVDALSYFEGTFGPYPLDALTVATVPRKYSQSYLGYITLAESALRQPNPLDAESKWQRATTIAHEIAHQWWGNLVGWWSYRDQWLSEGMANYSALLYDAHEAGSSSDYLALMSAGWRDSLGVTTLDGRTIESLGPIVLGNRLNSSRAGNAYRTIVYRKGAVVLAMLARIVGEERFVAMLRSLVDVASGHVLTTEQFLEAVERMSNLELDGFALQFVYGTGIPEVYYTYDRTPSSSGGWALEGQARLITAPRYGHRIVRTEDGRWEVERTTGPRVGAAATTLVVPYHVTLVGEQAREAHSGQLFLKGRHDSFRIETDREPVSLRLDPSGEILAWFYSEERHPKRVLRYEAEDLAIDGRWDEAEARYGEALALPGDGASVVDPLAPPPTVPRIDGRIEDLKIRLSVVRLHLARDRVDQAEQELGAIERELGDEERNVLRMERDVLRARVEMRRGDNAAAHRRLRKVLRIAAPEREHREWRDLLLQMQLSSERVATAEGYALLVLSARALGDADDLDWAKREARERGVDLSELERERD